MAVPSRETIIMAPHFTELSLKTKINTVYKICNMLSSVTSSKKKVKLSLLQAMEAHRVARG
jgi:hypothetical protein